MICSDEPLPRAVHPPSRSRDSPMELGRFFCAGDEAEAMPFYAGGAGTARSGCSKKAGAFAKEDDGQRRLHEENPFAVVVNGSS